MNSREQVNAKIWKLSNSVRGAISGWDFKNYVLMIIFYKFISEFYLKKVFDIFQINEKDLDKNETLIKKELGFFIKKSALFKNAVNTNNENIKSAFLNIQSNNVFGNIFSEFDFYSSRLGNTEEERNDRINKLMNGINDISINDGDDVFGDIYEFLISNYSAQAGKSGGEFFTPPCVSELLSKIAKQGIKTINKVYDPTCGTGSLLLKFINEYKNGDIKEGFYGQELNYTTQNLARMNMVLHGVDIKDFDIKLGDTLCNPEFLDCNNFDVIVSNPPYSVRWAGNDNKDLINDARFSAAGELAPKKAGDLAFFMHCLHYLSNTGRAAIVAFPGILYRQNAEKTIRKYLVDNNFIESVIALPANLFFNTTISVVIVTLSKNKKDKNINFIDASSLFKKSSKNNELTDEHINRIVSMFNERSSELDLSEIVTIEDVAKNDYLLSVSTYVNKNSNSEIIDIVAINSEIAEL